MASERARFNLGTLHGAFVELAIASHSYTPAAEERQVGRQRTDGCRLFDASLAYYYQRRLAPFIAGLSCGSLARQPASCYEHCGPILPTENTLLAGKRKKDETKKATRSNQSGKGVLRSTLIGLFLPSVRHRICIRLLLPCMSIKVDNYSIGHRRSHTRTRRLPSLNLLQYVR